MPRRAPQCCAWHSRATQRYEWQGKATQSLIKETEVRVKITIEGTAPLLMNRFTEENEVQVSGGTQPAFRGAKGTPREQAESKCYADKAGGLYLPGPNIFAAIIAAGIFHKASKSKLTTQKSSLIPAGLIIEEPVCSLGTRDWEVDSRSVVNPSTHGRIMCHRPRLDKWS